MAELTDRDTDAIAAFQNFLSWGEQPAQVTRNSTPRIQRRSLAHFPTPRAVPPAWWAHVLGATSWCPPAGEL
jgi:hypothetical protein